MNKIFSALLLTLAFSVISLGCNRSRRVEYHTGTAPTTTYSVVLLDQFQESDEQELRESIEIIISELLADLQPTVNINFDISINVTNTQIGPFNGGNHIHKDRVILVECGTDNECPELYEKLYACLFGQQEYKKNETKYKNRGRQICEDIKRRRGRK